MKNTFSSFVSALIFVLFSMEVTAQEDQSKAIESLSPGLRSLLQGEMGSIHVGMKEMITANAAGDVELIAKIARDMKQSYILKRSINKAQLAELRKLPSEFHKRDAEFHYLAGMLEWAAMNNKNELVVFYYSKLFSTCSGCHQQFATHKFPQFKVLDSSGMNHKNNH